MTLILETKKEEKVLFWVLVKRVEFFMDTPSFSMVID